MADRQALILVIEDSAEVRRSVRRALKRAGMLVHEAGTGEEGLLAAREHDPDLVLTDISMPGLDGFQVLERLRTDERTASTPVVLMTGRDDRASVRRGMSLGADDYLTKPFTSGEIVETVRARLKRLSLLTEDFETQLAKTRAALVEATHRDPETGLPNRLAFRARLATIGTSMPVTVLFVELDRFERIRSAVHATRPDIMETAIAELSARMTRTVGDSSSVYRIDTSRFALLACDADDPGVAVMLANDVLSAIRPPIGGGELELRFTGSIGIAVGDGVKMREATVVAGHAEVAAHNVRESGGNHAVLYDASSHDRAFNRMLLESSMHRALERGQFELHYQPQVAADTGQLTGLEALIRWNHPELGQISPFHFIPIAEETGLIVPIGEWVIDTACKQLSEWRDEFPNLRMGVNLSALQLAKADLAETVLDIISNRTIEARNLNLELTESMMIGAGEEAARSLSILRQAGVGVSIDDFGTGYSSLTNLRSFPITEVKVDRSFMRRIPADRDNCSIVSAVIEMAHQLGLRVIAEGVEEVEQLEFLRRCGCDEIQGYYYSKPLPADAIIEWARGHRRAA